MCLLSNAFIMKEEDLDITQEELNLLMQCQTEDLEIAEDLCKHVYEFLMKNSSQHPALQKKIKKNRHGDKKLHYHQFSAKLKEAKLKRRSCVTPERDINKEPNFIPVLEERRQKTLDDGTVEEGKFKDGVLEGYGSKKFSNGDFEEGFYVRGLLHGNGKKSLENGEILEGKFKYGYLNGKGSHTLTDGVICVGEFKDGLLEGMGSIEYPSQRIFLRHLMEVQISGQTSKIWECNFEQVLESLRRNHLSSERTIYQGFRLKGLFSANIYQNFDTGMNFKQPQGFGNTPSDNLNPPNEHQ